MNDFELFGMHKINRCMYLGVSELVVNNLGLTSERYKYPFRIQHPMDSRTTRVRITDLTQLKHDVAQIKNLLSGAIPNLNVEEGELSDWAKSELSKARSEGDEEYTSLAELKKEILA